MNDSMLPRERADYSAIVDRPPLKLPGDSRIIFWDLRLEASRATRSSVIASFGSPAGSSAGTMRIRTPLGRDSLVRKMVHQVLPLFEAGALSVPVAETFALAQAAAAYERFAAGGKLGKIVLTV